MGLLYNIGMWLYPVIIALVAPFNQKAKLFRQGRIHLYRQLQQAIPADAYVVWFHCASLGEFEQGRPLMENYRKQHPTHKILLTFFSPSGYEVRKNYTGADWVFYLPVDTPRKARRFVKIVHPQSVLFIKYDFWYNLLRALKKEAIPTYVVSAIFRPSQAFFKWYGGFFRRMLKVYRYLFVQNEYSKTLLSSINITNVLVTGDTRFDRVWELAERPEQYPLLEAFCDDKTIVAGSTWPADEEKLATAISGLPATTKLVIAPHEIHEEHLSAIEKLFKSFGVVRYSQLSAAPANHHSRILLLDTMGMLSSTYQYAALAYIGGGFGVGIHNILEAAVYGIPVVFGPNYQRFREACDLLNQGGAISYTSKEQLIVLLEKWLADTSMSHIIGAMNHQYVAHHCGATQAILQKINE